MSLPSIRTFPIIVTDDIERCTQLISQAVSNNLLHVVEGEELLKCTTCNIVKKGGRRIIFVNFYVNRFDTLFEYDFRFFVTSLKTFEAPDIYIPYGTIFYSDEIFSHNSMKSLVTKVREFETLEYFPIEFQQVIPEITQQDQNSQVLETIPTSYDSQVRSEVEPLEKDKSPSYGTTTEDTSSSTHVLNPEKNSPEKRSAKKICLAVFFVFFLFPMFLWVFIVGFCCVPVSYVKSFLVFVTDFGFIQMINSLKCEDEYIYVLNKV